MNIPIRGMQYGWTTRQKPTKTKVKQWYYRLEICVWENNSGAAWRAVVQYTKPVITYFSKKTRHKTSILTSLAENSLWDLTRLYLLLNRAICFSGTHRNWNGACMRFFLLSPDEFNGLESISMRSKDTEIMRKRYFFEGRLEHNIE